MRHPLLNDWDVLADGTLSRNGQTKFSVYGESGSLLPGVYATYKATDAGVETTIHDSLEEIFNVEPTA